MVLAVRLVRVRRRRVDSLVRRRVVLAVLAVRLVRVRRVVHRSCLVRRRVVLVVLVVRQVRVRRRRVVRQVTRSSLVEAPQLLAVRVVLVVRLVLVARTT